VESSRHRHVWAASGRRLGQGRSGARRSTTWPKSPGCC